MRIKYILLIMTIGLLAACSSDHDELTSANDGEDGLLRIAAGIDVQPEAVTRAVETAWEANDQIGVFITERSVQTIANLSGIMGQNLKYTFNDGTNYETYGNTYRLFSPTTKIFIPSTPVDVYGYYPYRAQDSNIDGVDDLPMTAIPINVSNQTSQKAIDLMRARTGNVNNENASIELLFQHRLVKLVFNLRQGEGLLPDELKDATFLGMSIANQYTKATYNVFSDNFVLNPLSESPQSVIPVRSSSAPTGYVRTFEAIVLPNGANNPVTDRTVTITFYRKSEDAIVNTFKIPSDTYFTSGYKYTYNVTVNATSIQVDKDKYTEQW